MYTCMTAISNNSSYMFKPSNMHHSKLFQTHECHWYV
uniref:Uncharacterized protein n=1 Tax=Anguilla anguilla TaxID=7936 RepID=A0A0E9XMW0_ANGAN